jgi:Response regulator receiver domain
MSTPAACGSAQTAAPIRVVLADDQPLIRLGFRMVLSSASDIELVGEAETGGLAVDLTTSLRPDVVLMDVRMPGMDGIEATRRIVSVIGIRDRVQHTDSVDRRICTPWGAGGHHHGGQRAGQGRVAEPGRWRGVRGHLMAMVSTAANAGYYAQIVARRPCCGGWSRPAPGSSSWATATGKAMSAAPRPCFQCTR